MMQRITTSKRCAGSEWLLGLAANRLLHILQSTNLLRFFDTLFFSFLYLQHQASRLSKPIWESY